MLERLRKDAEPWRKCVNVCVCVCRGVSGGLNIMLMTVSCPTSNNETVQQNSQPSQHDLSKHHQPMRSQKPLSVLSYYRA